MFVSSQGRFVFLHNPLSGNDRLDGGVDFGWEQSMPTYEELHLQEPNPKSLQIPLYQLCLNARIHDAGHVLFYKPAHP